MGTLWAHTGAIGCITYTPYRKQPKEAETMY